MAPNSRDTLKEYILRRLGSGIYEVELTPDQMDDIINDTLQVFEEFIDDGVIEKKLIVKVDPGANNIILPDQVMGISEVYYTETTSSTNYEVDPFSIKTKFANVYDHLLTNGQSQGDLTYITVINMYYETLKDIFNPDTAFDFNPYTKELSITESNIGGIILGMTVFWSSIESSRVYNHKFIKEYATSLAKKQWARNLSKYSNATIVGGMELNWQQLYQEATDELDKLEEDMNDRYSEPLGIFL